jgi:hypothetical protein
MILGVKTLVLGINLIVLLHAIGLNTIIIPLASRLEHKK